MSLADKQNRDTRHVLYNIANELRYAINKTLGENCVSTLAEVEDWFED
jgi:hypothetical protein